jgi:nucleoside-diphosphate-sugar epimerase
MKRILVTGGAGAIGSHLVSNLVAQGHKVTVLDDLSSGHKELVPEATDFINGSITEDGILEAAFEGRPDVVFHLAALFANQQSVDRPQLDLEVNGLGTLKVLEKCEQFNIQRFIYTSSSCVYGHQDKNLHEEDRLQDLDTPYAATKLLGEQYAKIWSQKKEFSVKIVRIFNSYGPNEFPGKYRNVIPNFIEKALRGESLTILGEGTETRDFTYVSDVVEGLLLASITKEDDFGIYNIGSGVGTKILDLADQINKISGNQAPITFAPRRNWDHILHRVSDISLAKEKLNFSPVVSISDGLQKTFEWFNSKHE